ncbi:hypothetical protein B0O80DRAFT_470162 [Mortierella sp. GBAus27b]|nr:hypothetical protein BGX31_008563 [Mortierella sp. GBA43]KAI8346018.1 hypothetical protein B0O80DRAFT_470162 [Mortierella sp. GBAus27b]
MFKKPLASLKSFSPLRSSDKRRLREEILATYPALRDMEPINDTPVATIITPEGLQSAKFTSHIEEPGTLYTDADGTPLWFKIGAGRNDSIIVPTVYTLWKFPNLVPGLTTWNPVVDKLRNGADLMIPGVITSGNTEVPNLEEGSLVVIFARGNKYPLGVGTMAISGRAIASSRGSLPPRGKAVHMLHVHDDQLWIMGSKLDLPADWSQGLSVPLNDEYQSSDEEDDEDGSGLANELKDVSVEPKGKAPKDEQQPGAEDDDDDGERQSSSQPTEAVVLSTEEVDRYLQEALLQVLKFKITEEVSKDLLPMNASTLYSSYVLPNRARGRAAEADIKKSSWKKLAKWLKTVEKQDLIKCKDVRGDLTLLSINWTHPDLKAFDGHKTMEQDVARQARVEAQSSQAAAEAKALEIVEAYRPNSLSAGLFEVTGRSKDGYYSLHDLKVVLGDYIKEKQLADPRNQRIVRLDDVLQSALCKKGEQADRLPRDQIIDRLSENMVLHHFIGHKDQEPRFVKGGAKAIQIVQEVRTRGKTVTRVSGLEYYFIDVDAFGQDMQVRCAGSVSITPLVGASPKLQLREVMVQGPQLKIVTAALQEKGVPKKYIESTDKTRKR